MRPTLSLIPPPTVVHTRQPFEAPTSAAPAIGEVSPRSRRALPAQSAQARALAALRRFEPPRFDLASLQQRTQMAQERSNTHGRIAARVEEIIRVGVPAKARAPSAAAKRPMAEPFTTRAPFFQPKEAPRGSVSISAAPSLVAPSIEATGSDAFGGQTLQSAFEPPSVYPVAFDPAAGGVPTAAPTGRGLRTDRDPPPASETPENFAPDVDRSRHRLSDGTSAQPVQGPLERVDPPRLERAASMTSQVPPPRRTSGTEGAPPLSPAAQAPPVQPAPAIPATSSSPSQRQLAAALKYNLPPLDGSAPRGAQVAAPSRPDKVPAAKSWLASLRPARVAVIPPAGPAFDGASVEVSSLSAAAAVPSREVGPAPQRYSAVSSVDPAAHLSDSPNIQPAPANGPTHSPYYVSSAPPQPLAPQMLATVDPASVPRTASVDGLYGQRFSPQPLLGQTEPRARASVASVASGAVSAASSVTSSVSYAFPYVSAGQRREVVVHERPTPPPLSVVYGRRANTSLDRSNLTDGETPVARSPAANFQQQQQQAHSSIVSSSRALLSASAASPLQASSDAGSPWRATPVPQLPPPTPIGRQQQQQALKSASIVLGESSVYRPNDSVLSTPLDQTAARLTAAAALQRLQARHQQERRQQREMHVGILEAVAADAVVAREAEALAYSPGGGGKQSATEAVQVAVQMAVEELQSRELELGRIQALQLQAYTVELRAWCGDLATHFGVEASSIAP